MDFLLLWILSYILLALAISHKYFTWHFNYFIDQGIQGPEPLIFFGNWWKIWKKQWIDIELERYKKYGQLYGTFNGRTPNVVISDPKLMREILIKDFDNFTDRPTQYFKNKYFSNGLGNLQGQKWKNVRNSMSPAFSSAKIKGMYVLIEECSKEFILSLSNKIDSGAKKVNIKSESMSFSLDVIASCAFGVKFDSFKNPDSIFVKKAAETFSNEAIRRPEFSILQIYPVLASLIPGKAFSGIDFFGEMSKKLLSERKKHLLENPTAEKRNDFLDLIIETYGESESDTKEKNSENENLQVAQTLQFLIAGLESIAGVLSFTINLLTVNDQIQEKLRNEINNAMIKEGKFSFDHETVNSLSYLDKCLSESLRMIPPGLIIQRVCTRATNYEGIKIDKGVIVTIPVYAIHHDPLIYPDPEKFDPERFSLEEKSKRDPINYLPFGAGNRNCIASRLALQEIKIVLCHLIHSFRFFPVYETSDPPNFHPGGFPFLQASNIIVGIQKI